MKKLIILVLFAAAAWYGWTHKDTLFVRHDGHEAVIVNEADAPIVRVRFTVDGQTTVKESIAAHDKAVVPFQVNNDSDFRLVWEYADRPGERSWQGGMIARGPILQRHTFEVDNEGGVTYHAEPKGTAAPN